MMVRRVIVRSPRESFRRLLRRVVAQTLTEIGFKNVDAPCLETLVEMLQSLISEVAQSTRRFHEIAGRSSPTHKDIVAAFVDMGISMDGLAKYADRRGRTIVPPPLKLHQPRLPLRLHVGRRGPHLPHIANYMPPLPDPHTYIHSPTIRRPIISHEELREKAALLKRDACKAFDQFIKRSSPTVSVVNNSEHDKIYSVMVNGPKTPAYLEALHPIDQIFDFDELEYYYMLQNSAQEYAKRKKKDRPVECTIESHNETETLAPFSESIDNPFLRAPRLPTRKKPNPTALSSTTLDFCDKLWQHLQ